MEHEVFVPVPAQRLKETLADPARVARAVPGLQQDAGAEPVTGRLKVRVGSHSVTYRGTVRVTPRDDGSYAAEGDATEARGTGSVKLALTLRVEEADGGSRLTFEGTAAADGRLTELPPEQVVSAATRLLNRFAENLAAAAEQSAESEPEASAEPDPLVTQDFEPKATSDFDTTPDAEDAPAPAPGPAEHTSVFETEVPPPSLDPRAEESDEPGTPEATGTPREPEDETAPEPAAAAPAPDDFTEARQPAAEAAHARRTMIGRSAEEVDHAPPRGRYAPVPAPQTVSAGSSLRWAAPAAALVLASAIVVGRALRKRH
ncbi:SRPBCC domain-containing protein [Streptomyces sp. NBC_00005]|uniref:SRPBCC domain-containing protein n=1 Tax=Streptomyces sp. NBC_00005 TaxID=2903609 RepID=UPI0032438776